MAGWQHWAVIVGGIFAIVNHWYGSDFFLGVIGGVLVLLGAFMQGK